MSDFKYLFEPRSIAVVGVSDNYGRPGSAGGSYAFDKMVTKANYFRSIQKYEQFEGLKCYRSVAAIEESVDLVVTSKSALSVSSSGSQ